MKTLIAFLILSMSSLAIADNRKISLYSEYAWQLLHLMDAGQTYHMAKNSDCFSEGNSITSKIIGRDPHPDKVIAWAIVSSISHNLIFRWADNYFSHDDMNIFLRGVTLGFKARTVYGNYDTGLSFRGMTYSGREYCDNIRKRNQVQFTILRF